MTARVLRPAALAFGLLLALGGFALAKGPATARFVTPLPAGAPPGATLQLEVEVSVVGEDGEPVPMKGSPVFIRLSGSTGAASEAAGDEVRPGAYRARVVVPDGGIARVEVGLRGTATYPDGSSERSDWLFEIEGPVFAPDGAAAAPVVKLPPVEPSPPVAIGIALAVFAGVGLISAVRLRRARAARAA